MKKNKLMTLGILSAIGIGLFCGAVSAAWAVTDDAGDVNIVVGVGTINSHRVRFLSPDGSQVLYTEDVLEGQTLSSVPDADDITVPTGYVFNEWATNNTTFTKYSGNMATQTFTSNTDYYARFASYGYTKNGGAATHLPNKWDINNNITLAQNDVIHVGTYIQGKSSLEDDGGTATTISNAGGYAIVCDEHEATWNATKAGNIANWFIEKYYTYTITDAMRINNYGLFAHFYNSDGSKTQTQIMTDNLISGNQYFVYGPNFAAKVIFGALKSSTPRDMGTDWGNVIKQFSEITLSSTSAYSAPATAKVSDIYFRGDNNGWGATTETQLSESFDSNNIGEMLNVSLTAGNNFKIANSAWTRCWQWSGYKNGDSWIGMSVIQGDTGYFGAGDSDDNIKCNTTGVYNFYLTNSNQIYVVKVS